MKNLHLYWHKIGVFGTLNIHYDKKMDFSKLDFSTSSYHNSTKFGPICKFFIKNQHYFSPTFQICQERWNFFINWMRKQQKHFWPMFIAKYCILFICMCKQTVNDCWSFLCGLLLADVMLVSVPCYYVVHCVIQCLCSHKQKLLGVALSLQGVTAVLWCQSNISYYVYVWLWWWLDTSVRPQPQVTSHFLFIF